MDIDTGYEPSDADLESDEVRMVEVLVMPESRWLRKSARAAGFRQATGLSLLAIHSPGSDRDFRSQVSSQRLGAGDVLLLQGSVEDIQRLDPADLLNLEDVSAHHPTLDQGARCQQRSSSSALVVAATGILPMSVAFLSGIVALVLSQALRPEEAYRSIDWRLLVLIGCMMAFGVAMKETGTSAFLADLVVRFVSPFGNLAVLAAFFVLTSFLTQPMSNQAAALIVLPVAIESARSLGVDPRSLVMSVTFAASCSFSDAAGAGLYPGLRAGPVPFLRFLQGGSTADPHRLRLLHVSDPDLLAVSSLTTDRDHGESGHRGIWQPGAIGVRADNHWIVQAGPTCRRGRARTLVVVNRLELRFRESPPTNRSPTCCPPRRSTGFWSPPPQPHTPKSQSKPSRLVLPSM